MIKLKENERLISAGETQLRAPNGTPLPSVPQYMIVTADEADPDCVVDLKKNECLVLAGRVFNNKKSAEERFAALKKGREQPPREDGTPLYIKENEKNINPNGFTETESKANKTLGMELVTVFEMQMRKKKSLERQGVRK